MNHSKQIILTIGIGLALTGAGVGIAAASGSSPPAVTVPATAPAASPTATINVTTASVGGKSERILVDARGLPLYTFVTDTPTASHVQGGLAVLWPPLVSTTPTESGLSGTLTVVPSPNGQQVQYNGHFLYTFVDDTPGQVTGQGVQGFSVATPELTSGSTNAAAAPASNLGGGYGSGY